MLVVAALFALLSWALIRSEGVPGGLGINKIFGEVAIKEEPAPDFSLQLFEGGSLDLSSLEGKVVMIDFWSSWCAPCVVEAPALAQVYKEYQERGVEFVGISIWDRRKKALDHLQRFGITFPSGLDTQGTILVDYGVRGIPEKYFVDSQGRLVRKFVGPSTVEGLRRILDELLTTPLLK